MKDRTRKYIVKFYYGDHDVYIGETCGPSEYCSEETEAESSYMAIEQVIDYLMEVIIDGALFSEYSEEDDELILYWTNRDNEDVGHTLERKGNKIYIKDENGKVIEYFYGFFVDSLIGEAMENAGLSKRDMYEQFGIPMKTLEEWLRGDPVLPDWAESLILEKLESMAANHK